MGLSTKTMTRHKNIMTGMLIDEVNSFYLTYSGETNTNLHMYHLINNTFFK